MKTKFQIIIIGLTLLSCSEPLDNLRGKNLYTYADNADFFPERIVQSERFPADKYEHVLKQLDEKSLADKYREHEIIRLTAIRSFRNHFTIIIEKTDNGVQLTEKETYPDSRPVDNGDTTKLTYDIIEFDSLTGKYMEVRKYWPMGINPIEVELERKVINPIVKKESTKVSSVDWNALSKMLDRASFWEMNSTDSVQGFDGHHYILETHTKAGYYLVDRWSPRGGEFKTIIDYIIGLSSYKGQSN
jgi:hypothetical protein